MQRPAGLPSRDARTETTRRESAFLVSSYEGAPWVGLINPGMVDTPTKAMQEAVDASIDRKLALLRKR